MHQKVKVYNILRTLNWGTHETIYHTTQNYNFNIIKIIVYNFYFLLNRMLKYYTN